MKVVMVKMTLVFFFLIYLKYESGIIFYVTHISIVYLKYVTRIIVYRFYYLINVIIIFDPVM